MSNDNSTDSNENIIDIHEVYEMQKAHNLSKMPNVSVLGAKINKGKLKRRKVNKIPFKFNLASPVNFVKRLNISGKLAKQDTKNRRKPFSITIAPFSSGKVKTFKISNIYVKFAVIWVLFLAISIYSLSSFINIWIENKYLKASIDDLYSMNAKQNLFLNENYEQIQQLIVENSEVSINVSELATKYKEIVDKYIDNRVTTGIASRSSDRSGNVFSTDVKELQNILSELSQVNESKENILIDLSDSEAKLREFIASLPTQWPVGGKITSKFGQRRDPITRRISFHKGIDIAASYGVKIKAAGSGKVIFVGYYNEYGQAVIIDHGDGITTLYGHASKILVKKGELVNKDTVIANVGSSGRSTGAHLHFEIRINNNPVDPTKYLDKTN